MPSDLTLEERATNDDTWRHIHRVGEYIDDVITELMRRRRIHDLSKLGPPEVAAFAKYTASLAGLTYGSPEYNARLLDVDMSPALAHHYANNRHHPQYFLDGVNGMTLIDLIEMLCDWKAASERHNDGNIKQSISHNAGRFGLSPQLVGILDNTAEALFG